MIPICYIFGYSYPTSLFYLYYLFSIILNKIVPTVREILQLQNSKGLLAKDLARDIFW